MTEQAELPLPLPVIEFSDGGSWAIPLWATYAGGVPRPCRGCEATILFVKALKNGKPAPIDRDGTSHFATCPNAERFRR